MYRDITARSMGLIPRTPTTSQLMQIPNGAAGTLATLKLMRDIVRACKKQLPIRQLALQLANGHAQKDYVAEVRSIFRFVRDRIRYIKDVRGVETLQTAIKTLELGQGDCDDKSTLAASLLEAIGHPTRFVAIGFHKGMFQHVYLETRIGDKWIALETTEPWPLGKRARGEVERMVVYN